jgi:geranylgeranylglycerol-phosphate geranylgeranyltransferase
MIQKKKINRNLGSGPRNQKIKVSNKSSNGAEYRRALFKLIRPGNCAMAGLAVLIGYYVSGGMNLQIASLAFLASFFVCAGGQTINDFFDYYIDLRNGKKNEILSIVKRKDILAFSGILFLIGLSCAGQISSTALIVATLMAVLLVVYSWLLPKLKYVGNFVVAFGSSLTFIFGSLCVPNLGYMGISEIAIALALTAFFSTMGREITKDFEDLKKDKGTKITLPMLNEGLAKDLVSAYYAIAILIALIAYNTFSFGIIYLFATLASIIVFATSISRLWAKDYEYSQKLSKTGMMLSLIAFVLAKLK